MPSTGRDHFDQRNPEGAAQALEQVVGEGAARGHALELDGDGLGLVHADDDGQLPPLPIDFLEHQRVGAEVALLGLMSNTASSVFFMAEAEGRRFARAQRALKASANRHDVEGIAHDAVVRRLEEGGLGVLVDDHDDLGSVDAGEVLDGAGDADGDVQVGPDGDAGLSDVFVVGAPTDVRHWAGAGGRG